MPDQHEFPTKTYRPDPVAEYGAVKLLLPEGRSMGGLMRAVLRWIVDNPQAAFEILGPYWPPVKRGRPPKNPRPNC